MIKYYGYVYVATNIINNNKYVGITTGNLKSRMALHKSNAKQDKNNRHFYNAINKYGWDSFQWKVIDYAHSLDELYLKEKSWIIKLNTYNGFPSSKGYNSTIGGDGVNGFKPNKESIQKSVISRGMKPFWAFDIYGEFVGEYLIGYWAARELGLSRSSVNNVLMGHSRTAGNYTFIYKDEFTTELLQEKITKTEDINQGSSNGSAKLDEKIAEEIMVTIMNEPNMTFYEIGKRYNVSRGTVSTVNQKKTWKNVSEDFIPRNSRILETEVKKVKQMYVEGKKPKEISELVSMDYTTILKILNGVTHVNISVPGFAPRKSGKKSKLTKNEVKEIKALLDKGIMTQKEIGVLYDVHATTIGKIKRKERWKDI